MHLLIPTQSRTGRRRADDADGVYSQISTQQAEAAEAATKMENSEYCMVTVDQKQAGRGFRGEYGILNNERTSLFILL